MKITEKIYLTVLVLFTLSISSQNEFRNWYFGQQAGLDFSTNPPTILTNGILNNVEGFATISDNNGNLLFYTDGISVVNSTHTIMANGLSLFGNGSSTQSALIVKQPGNNTFYYIFTTAAFGNPIGANYSIVDMSLAAGLGSVTVKNATLYTPTCEKQVAVRHCNGKDVWIVSHHYGSNEFRAHLLTSTGVSNTAVVSAIGETIAGVGYAGAGQLKISPDGKKLAMATASNSIPTSLGNSGFHLFDFNAATGIVSNSITLLSGISTTIELGAYGVEFSPDGTKLYGLTGPATTNSSAVLYQWSICGSSSSIVSSQYSISTGAVGAGSLQRAIDGKIYMAASLSQSLGVINNPNASGAAINFAQNGLSISPKNSHLGLPNYINNYTRPLPTPFTNNIACQTASFSIPPVPTFSSGCTSTPYAPSSYLWDFGEPTAGAANSSTLANPVHTYAGIGTYTASLILYGACTNDTLKEVITLTTPGPTVNVSGNFNICKGEKFTYTASGASTYLWSSGSTATSITLNPTATTVYSLSGTLNSCTLSKSFTVNVNPCTGIKSQEKSTAFTIYPNPFKEVISVESAAPSSLMIFNVDGKLIQENKLKAGYNEINTGELSPGIYLIQAKDAEGLWRGRFVKVE